MAASTKPERKRSVEEAPSYGVGKRIRIEILGILNEGVYSVSELAKMIRLPLTTVSHHIKEMLDAGCIELAKVKKVRNADQHFYRAVELPEVDDEEAAKLPVELKQEYAAVILQAIMAESMGALWAGKLTKPQVRMLWRWFHLDQQGRAELADELRESWERITQIEARSFNRVTTSGEKPVTMIAAMLGFERFRPVGTTAPAKYRSSPPGKAE